MATTPIVPFFRPFEIVSRKLGNQPCLVAGPGEMLHQPWSRLPQSSAVRADRRAWSTPSAGPLGTCGRQGCGAGFLILVSFSHISRVWLRARLYGPGQARRGGGALGPGEAAWSKYSSARVPPGVHAYDGAQQLAALDRVVPPLLPPPPRRRLLHDSALLRQGERSPGRESDVKSKASGVGGGGGQRQPWHPQGDPRGGVRGQRQPWHPQGDTQDSALEGGRAVWYLLLPVPASMLETPPQRAWRWPCVPVPRHHLALPRR